MPFIKKPFRLRLKPPQILVLGFTVMILLGSVLLSLPIATHSGESTPYMDALFTATSAACVTGLTVEDTGTYFNVFGQVVLLLLVQIGGLGFMTMATLIAFVLKKRISLKERLILQEAMNHNSIEGIVRLIQKVLVYSLCIQAAGMVIFTIRWSFDMPFGQALYFGLFHAISFFNNAGFDIFGPVTGPFTSITRYAEDPVITLTTCLLIILGGVGFVVIADLLEFRHKRKLTLHSKVVLSMSALLIGAGAIVIFIFEFTNPNTLGPLSWFGKIWASLFQSVTPRSGGASTLDVNALRQATQFFMVILIFIGASPGSTGGGIKTTTFAILLGAMVAMLRGKQDIVLFRMRLAQDRIFKAITLTLLTLFLIILGTMVLSTTEEQSFLAILFEVASAFSTAGLTMNVTPHLTEVGKVVIMVLMFMGRLGPVTLAYALGPKQEKDLFRYPEGKIAIG